MVIAISVHKIYLVHKACGKTVYITSCYGSLYTLSCTLLSDSYRLHYFEVPNFELLIYQIIIRYRYIIFLLQTAVIKYKVN